MAARNMHATCQINASQFNRLTTDVRIHNPLEEQAWERTPEALPRPNRNYYAGNPLRSCPICGRYYTSAKSEVCSIACLEKLREGQAIGKNTPTGLQ
jgi:hypothetical protein